MIFFQLTAIQPGLPDDVIDSFIIYAQIGSEREKKKLRIYDILINYRDILCQKIKSQVSD